MCETEKYYSVEPLTRYLTLESLIFCIPTIISYPSIVVNIKFKKVLMPITNFCSDRKSNSTCKI